MRAIGVLILGGAALRLACGAAAAQQQDPKQDAGEISGTSDRDDAENNGNDLTRPQNNLDVRFRYQTSAGTSSRTERETTYLRASSRIELEPDWKLSLYGQLPLVTKATTTFDPLNTDREFGIGDSVLQAGLIHTVDERWAFGFGARMVAPTAEDNLGSGKWQIMPVFGVRYSLPELGPDSYFVPAVRYAVSFAGDPSKRNISEPQIAPTLNIGLPDRWFVTFYPSYDIRINYGDPISGRTGRLFLPFNAPVGRKLTDRLVVSLEAGVPIIKDYPVYNFKTELRFVMKF